LKKNVYEILDEFRNAKDERAKRQVLVDNATPDFVAFLQLSFNPHIKFTVKDIPKYNPSPMPPGMGYTNMGNAIGKTYLFIEGHPKRPNLTDKKQTELLIQVLESLEAREAEVYTQMITKSVKVPKLDLKLLEKTFEGFLNTPKL
jgi:hypothetical protein